VTDAEQLFAAERPRLLGLAYRVLGSFGDAEDVVQEAWLRWAGVDHAGVERPGAYLTTVVTRLALDRVRAVARRREQYVGPWLPEPVALEPGPEEHTEMAESLTLGFLLLLDRLTPAERAVWLLAVVFEEPYALIAEAVGRSEAACRQLASRAGRRLRQDRPLPAEPLDAQLLARLAGAIAAGDVEGTLALLDADVVLVSDGGPAHRAARRPVLGPERVARLMHTTSRRYPGAEVELTEINHAAALVLRAPGTEVVVTGEQRQGRVTRLYFMLNPDKLAGLAKDHSALA